jgi:hypothetical protein
MFDSCLFNDVRVLVSVNNRLIVIETFEKTHKKKKTTNDEKKKNVFLL